MALLHFDRRYFIPAIFLLLTEYLIGAYVHDNFVRPYVGDYLIVIFLYCFTRAFIRIEVKPAALLVLLTAYAIEALQYLNILDVLGWRHSALANLVMGNWFEWTDILAYSLGVLTIVITEQRIFSGKTDDRLFI